jgi:hypothetical protein
MFMKRKILLPAVLALCAVFGFSQTVVTLDDALVNMTQYFTGRLPAKSKVVVLNITADSDRMAEYIIEEFTTNLVNSGKVTVVDRQNLESIRKELDFQVSGEVDDDTAQSIGRMLGAQTIFSGSIGLLGDFYRLRFRAIAVQTAEIQGMQSANVGQDKILASLTGGRVSVAPPSVRAVTPAAPAASAASAPSAAASAQSASGKPVKKTPARLGNFEIIRGATLPTPIDMTKFHTAALAMARKLEYQVLEDNPGVLLYRYTRGSQWVQIRLCYWTDEYWFEYINSYDMDANPAADKIHRVYRRWIENADKELAENYR